MRAQEGLSNHKHKGFQDHWHLRLLRLWVGEGCELGAHFNAGFYKARMTVSWWHWELSEVEDNNVDEMRYSFCKCPGHLARISMPIR